MSGLDAVPQRRFGRIVFGSDAHIVGRETETTGTGPDKDVLVPPEPSMNVPLAETPPIGETVDITVRVEPVPGEEKTDNNEATFTAIFSR